MKLINDNFGGVIVYEDILYLNMLEFIGPIVNAIKELDSKNIVAIGLLSENIKKLEDRINWLISGPDSPIAILQNRIIALEQKNLKN